MIARYTRPEMGKLWTAELKFATMLEVELAAAKVQARLGLIPRKALPVILKKAKFQVARIDEIEQTTRHDVIAFVTNVAENIGEYGRFVHFGLTSSDVLDTALSLQIGRAGEVLAGSLEKLEKSLLMLVKKHKSTLSAGRTHGMHAEPTSFGLKMAGFLAEFRRHKERFDVAMQQIAVGKLSGAVGTYSALGPEVEAGVCKLLALRPETVATQVIPRDRHAEVILSLAMIGGGLERLAIELRHLQRTEVGEVTEGFVAGQKGSSAMPHKKNPISAENITGVARLLRSYVGPALENIALWHERDISHSAVERVVFADAFILCDYAVERMARVLKDLKVNSERMLKNMEHSQGQLFSSHLLLALVEKGLSREEAYARVQKVSHQMKPGQHLRDAILKSKDFGLTAREVDQVFSGRAHKAAIAETIKRVIL